MLNQKSILSTAIALALMVAFTLTFMLTDLESIVKGLQQKNTCISDETSGISQKKKNTYGEITDKVAVITDTFYTPRLIPLILHYHAVLGPEWPIVFYTSKELKSQHLESNTTGASWTRAVQENRVEVRIVPDGYDLTSRSGVNLYLSRPWLWEQLAPAKHVLLFQADAILCANSHLKVEDFFQYDFVGAPMTRTKRLFNGGLSLRNRPLLLDILKEGDRWENDPRRVKGLGEDGFFSEKIDARGGSLPDKRVAKQFALQYLWQYDSKARPMGYHKIQKSSPGKLEEIASWCPEILLTKRGKLQS